MTAIDTLAALLDRAGLPALPDAVRTAIVMNETLVESDTVLEANRIWEAEILHSHLWTILDKLVGTPMCRIENEVDRFRCNYTGNVFVRALLSPVSVTLLHEMACPDPRVETAFSAFKAALLNLRHDLLVPINSTTSPSAVLRQLMVTLQHLGKKLRHYVPAATVSSLIYLYRNIALEAVMTIINRTEELLVSDSSDNIFSKLAQVLILARYYFPMDFTRSVLTHHLQQLMHQRKELRIVDIDDYSHQLLILGL